MLIKRGVDLRIIRVGSLDVVANGKSQLVESHPHKTSEFLYFASKAIAGDDPNGNGDYFPWSQLLKSHSTFVGRNLFLNHDSSDPRKAIGKVLDAYPVEDSQTGEKYIECLAKIDAVANPDLARQLIAGILDAVSMGCFKAGTPVLMADGTHRNIENVKEGEYVITHAGTKDKVLKTFKRPYLNQIYNIKFRGLFQLPLVTTEEHPFWVIKKENIVKKDDLVLCLTENQNAYISSKFSSVTGTDNFEWVKAADLRIGDYVAIPFPTKIETPKYVTKDFARLFGYYLSEGNITYDKRAGRGVIPVGVYFSLHLNETKYHEEILSLIKKITGKTAHIYHDERKLGTNISLFDEPLASRFLELGKEYAKEKSLAESVWYWDPKLQLELLGSFINGDGFSSEYKNEQTSPVKRLYAETGSYNLALQFCWILSRNNILWSLEKKHYKEHEAHFKKGTVKIKESTTYRICISGAAIKPFKKITDKIPDLVKVADVPSHNQRKFILNNYVMVPVAAIEAEDYNDYVYNLEVENRNSYVANGIAVHNCSCESSICSICGHTVYSDQDTKCFHLSKGLLKEYLAETDLPDFNIKKGQRVKAFAINQGINFTELSVVNVPAWNNAKIVQVISQLKEIAAAKQEVPAEMLRQLEDLVKMSTPNEPVKLEAPVSEVKLEDKESRIKKLFSEKLSALEYLDILDFVKKGAVEAKKEEPKKELEMKKEKEEKKEEKAERKEEKEEKKEEKKAEVETKVEIASDASKIETPKIEATETPEVKISEVTKVEEIKSPHLDAWLTHLEQKKVSAEVLQKFKDTWKTSFNASKNDELATKSAMETLPKDLICAPKSLETPVENTDLKAIFVSKPSLKESYWVVTDNGKPVMKATLEKIWQDKLAKMVDYATSADYGDALLTRIQEDGVAKVATITNAILYVAAAHKDDKNLQGKEEPVKPAPPASRGQVGPAGGEWPAEKSVGRDQYTPAAESEHAKIKKTPEGVDMSGGGHTPALGQTGGSATEWPTQKTMDKGQYKPAGGKHASEEVAITITAEPAKVTPEAQEFISKHIEKHIKEDKMEPERAKAAAYDEARKHGFDVPEKKAELETKAEPEVLKENIPTELPKDGPITPAKDVAAMSDMEKLEYIASVLDLMQPDDKLRKPLEGVHKALEKMESALAKKQEADAKAADKAAEEARKEQEKAEAEAKKEADKAAKVEEKERAKEEKEKAKEEKTEKKEEKKEKVEVKKELPMEKKEEPKEEPKEEKKSEVEPPVAKEASTTKTEIPSSPTLVVNEREKQLEAELASLKLSNTLREKTLRAQSVVNEMADKGLIVADEVDVQESIKSGLSLFDARHEAFKKAMDKQCADLLKLDNLTLSAFAKSIGRVNRATNLSESKVLRRAFNMQFDSSLNDEDKWLSDIFNKMK